MTATETVSFLRHFNRWRRGDDSMPQPQPGKASEAIDAACEHIGRLEHELREARRIANEMSESNEVLLADLHYTRQDIKKARKALEDIAALDTSQDASPQQCAAVLLAMSSLGK